MSGCDKAKSCYLSMGKVNALKKTKVQKILMGNYGLPSASFKFGLT